MIDVIITVIIMSVIFIVALAAMYPNLMELAKSQADDKYNAALSRLKKENDNLKCALLHPHIEISMIGGSEYDYRTKNQIKKAGT